MFMSKYIEKINELMVSGNGVIFTRDVSDERIPRDYLTKMVSDGKLERVGRGEYLAPGAFDDVMFRLQQKHRRAIFSHDTALFLHGLSDRDPIRYAVTVPSGYNASLLKSFPADVYYINKDLHELGSMEMRTDFGHAIRCYDRERAICDVIRNRSKNDLAVTTTALKEYIRAKNRNIPLLMEYAEAFRITKQIRSYLEVLL
jgi:predicted transcriptional regulator of viral defense system